MATAARLVTGEHRHDLRASLRRGERRSHRHSWRYGTKRTRHLALQHRSRDGMGTSAQTIADPTDTPGRDAFGDRDESRGGQSLLCFAATGKVRTRWRRRRRPAVYVLD